MAKFIKSATAPEHYPPEAKSEIAFLGRSNAGKSTLLNALTGQSLAKVSSKPGVTALVNFFSVDNRPYDLVDLPGYGFAKRSGSEQKQWQNMIETFLLTRQVLTTAVLVMDARRDWSTDEMNLVQWLQAHRDIKIVVALTKSDKLNQKEKSERMRHFSAQNLPVTWLFVSGEKKKGLKELESAFDISQGTW